MSLAIADTPELEEKSFVFSYPSTLPGKHLKSEAVRWTCNSPSSYSHSQRRGGGSNRTLLFLNGISLDARLWLPIVRRLFSQQNGMIRSMWALERPVQGAAAVMNAEVLSKEQTPLPMAEWTPCVQAFLEGRLMSPEEKTNLIVITHSAAIVNLLDLMELEKPPFKSVILIEPTTFTVPERGSQHEEQQRKAYKVWCDIADLIAASRMKHGNAYRNVGEAVSESALKERGWRKLHPEVKHIIKETYFIPTGSGDAVTTKTPILHEIDLYKELRNVHNYSARLLLILKEKKVDIHMVCGDRVGYWPKPLDRDFHRYIEDNRNLQGQGGWASVSVINGGGHFAPVQMPHETADVLLNILERTRTVGRQHAYLARL